MTGNREDYIKAIYELGGEKNRIATKSIAEVLKVSPPSVSEMIKKLVEEGYIEYQLYRGVKLTKKGRKEALRIKKRHLLWEVFLVDKLGYKWEDVHEEAELLEHITSEKLERHLEKYLDYPKICPHGTPLDDDSYIFYNTSLDSIEENKLMTVIRFEDKKEILRFMKSVDLEIGDLIKVSHRDKDGNIILKKEGNDIRIEEKFTRQIYVK